MILGIEHLAINLKCIDEFEKTLLSTGYKCLFKEEIPNDPNKKPFLKQYFKSHKISYYQSNENQFPIELTQHGEDISNKKTPISFKDNTIYLRINNIEEEISTWSILLGTESSKNDEISFMSLLPKRNFSIKFLASEKVYPYTLDTEGCTCIALLTNNINQMISSLEGIEKFNFLGPWESVVNKKKLLIGMFKTTGNVIIELIQVVRKNEKIKKYY